MSIRIFYDEVSYRYKGWRKLEEILKEIIRRVGKTPGELGIIITNDRNLIGINKEFLEHDYYTDVITFDYNSGSIVNGEVYISLDTVKTNSVNYNVSLHNELTRVIIHGILHLTGYEDKTEEDRLVMRSEEDRWLEKVGG